MTSMAASGRLQNAIAFIIVHKIGPSGIKSNNSAMVWRKIPLMTCMMSTVIFALNCAAFRLAFLVCQFHRDFIISSLSSDHSSVCLIACARSRINHTPTQFNDCALSTRLEWTSVLQETISRWPTPPTARGLVYLPWEPASMAYLTVTVRTYKLCVTTGSNRRVQSTTSSQNTSQTLSLWSVC